MQDNNISEKNIYKKNTLNNINKILKENYKKLDEMEYNVNRLGKSKNFYGVYKKLKKYKSYVKSEKKDMEEFVNKKINEMLEKNEILEKNNIEVKEKYIKVLEENKILKEKIKALEDILYNKDK
ncbi:hypothetical protein SLOPH_659 [Spraguea lophii 42_110]|uniref:Uncharacterized protein n=1 Tax=Spraguea lophii (strain 42_110) TaxID=1358809 RepID=S7XPF7_SPRLO|nr:hypothetical protein SLOPH_659 [Spraguea lophii 42_110]